MSSTHACFGNWVTIDNVPNCPTFTFWFPNGPICDGNQYRFRLLGETESFCFDYATTCEDCEVGAGFLQISNFKENTIWFFRVSFSHDGDPRVEQWGFDLLELIPGSVSTMTPATKSN